MAKPQYELVKNTGSAPEGAVQLGLQKDASGNEWTAVAHTQWGDIPGKATGGTCWYPYGGLEHKTQDFSWLVSPKSELVLMMNDGSGPPPTAFKIGHQNDGEENLYAAIAVSDSWGSIPGKAKDNTCWFPYDGKEHRTDLFYWVGTRFKLEKSSDVPVNAVQLGKQKNYDRNYYSVVAHTQWGDIPGKSKEGNCWFPHGGKEHTTDSFSYVITPRAGAFLTRNSNTGPPATALRVGHQTDGAGDLYAAVAITEEWGTIPGKSKDNTCWYSYGSKEYTTSDFYWVTSVNTPTRPPRPIEEILKLVKESLLEWRNTRGQTVKGIRALAKSVQEHFEQFKVYDTVGLSTSITAGALGVGALVTLPFPILSLCFALPSVFIGAAGGATTAVGTIYNNAAQKKAKEDAEKLVTADSACLEKVFALLQELHDKLKQLIPPSLRDDETFWKKFWTKVVTALPIAGLTWAGAKPNVHAASLIISSLGSNAALVQEFGSVPWSALSTTGRVISGAGHAIGIAMLVYNIYELQAILKTDSPELVKQLENLADELEKNCLSERDIDKVINDLGEAAKA